MRSKDTVDKLNEALNRLMLENAQLRRKIEKAQVIIRQRSPNADGLKLEASLKTILNDRDAAQNRIGFYRNQMKKILKILLDGNLDEAKKEINHFLFHNHD